MKLGTTYISLIPVRSEAAESSEMTTQVLFGEKFEIVEEQEKWLYIRILNDNYEGWIDRKMCVYIEEAQHSEKKKALTKSALTNLMSLDDKTNILIPMGSELVHKDGTTFQVYKKSYQWQHEKEEEMYPSVIKKALQFLNAPYLWGGKSIMGIDCSGLTQVCYKCVGVQLPRDASQQVEVGEARSFISEAEAGDLAFFDNEEGRIIHVGILLSKDEIIHASGSVRIDKIDHQGIYNQDLKKYTHKLRIIKKIS